MDRFDRKWLRWTDLADEPENLAGAISVRDAEQNRQQIAEAVEIISVVAERDVWQIVRARRNRPDVVVDHVPLEMKLLERGHLVGKLRRIPPALRPQQQVELHR